MHESVAAIRARTRPTMPVAVIGQMFDAFSDAPTLNTQGAAEILACAAAARDSRALDLSFFEWRHVSAEEESAYLTLVAEQRCIGSCAKGRYRWVSGAHCPVLTRSPPPLDILRLCATVATNVKYALSKKSGHLSIKVTVLRLLAAQTVKLH